MDTSLMKEVLDKIEELEERVVGRGEELDLQRVLFFLRLVLEGIPREIQSNVCRGIYVLESSWCFDGSNKEFATVTLEVADADGGYESMLEPDFPAAEKEKLMGFLSRLFEGQVPRHGNYRMNRVYKVIGQRSRGLNLIFPAGLLEDGVVDLALVMKPLFEFDEKGNPVPCKISESKKD